MLEARIPNDFVSVCFFGFVQIEPCPAVKPSQSSPQAHFLVVCTSSEATMVPARSSARVTGLLSGTASTQRAGLEVALLYCSSHTEAEGEGGEGWQAWGRERRLWQLRTGRGRCRGLIAAALGHTV